MSAVARGNLASMSELYTRRHRVLFRFFYRLTSRQALAEDLTHEVFLRMLRYRHTYTSGDDFEAWMYRIARNALADQSKKYRLEVPQPSEGFDPPVSGRPTAFDLVARGQELAILHRALAQLTPDKREIIVLSRFQGFTAERIANILGCEPGAARVRIFRAVKEMARIYSELEKEKAS
jgi:RNA polymerase sigma-70 factor (ECF subfamily)